MLQFSQFNKDISQRNVLKVTDMSRMFYSSRFNGDISMLNEKSKIHV
ncbi:MAG: BspA family leucine-rich repeat surface protein [Bacteroidales bacterium]|nr:BspA family leucine-rich repeat surface protein [Candidatus Scybalocola fimicaballi]